MITAERYHDVSFGHRVYGHENACAHLHGHNYRFHFTVSGEMKNSIDLIGRVIDFSVIKERLCAWLENNWDHKFLLFETDPLYPQLKELDPDGVISVPFNPTAENLAFHMVNVVGPQVLQGTECKLIKCRVDETRKCSAIYEL